MFWLKFVCLAVVCAALESKVLQCSGTLTTRSFNTVLCKLTTQPILNATVYFNSTELELYNCTMTFTTLNWNISQAILVSPPDRFLSSSIKTALNDTANLHFAIRGGSTTLNNQTGTITVTKEIPTGRVCTSVGDPHFTSFEGVPFNHMDLGILHLVQDVNAVWDIQVVQIPAPGKTSMNAAVSILYRNSIMILDIRSFKAVTDIRWETPVRVGEIPPSQSDFIELKRNGSLFTARLESGDMVSVLVHSNDDGSLNSIDVSVFEIDSPFASNGSDTLARNRDWTGLCSIKKSSKVDVIVKENIVTHSSLFSDTRIRLNLVDPICSIPPESPLPPLPSSTTFSTLARSTSRASSTSSIPMTTHSSVSSHSTLTHSVSHSSVFHSTLIPSTSKASTKTRTIDPMPTNIVVDGASSLKSSFGIIFTAMAGSILGNLFL